MSPGLPYGRLSPYGRLFGLTPAELRDIVRWHKSPYARGLTASQWMRNCLYQLRYPLEE